MDNIIIFLAILGVIVVLYLLIRREGLAINDSPFQYPAELSTAAGNAGWGCRNQAATYKTLLWEQSRPWLLMPNTETRIVDGYHSHMVPSAPVEKKQGCENCRPPQVDIIPRARAVSNYASW